MTALKHINYRPKATHYPVPGYIPADCDGVPYTPITVTTRWEACGGVMKLGFLHFLRRQTDPLKISILNAEYNKALTVHNHTTKNYS